MLSVKETRSAADLRLAELDFREGRRPEAQKRLDELLKREPNNAQAMVLQGEFLSAEGRYDDAITRLRARSRRMPIDRGAVRAWPGACAAKNDQEQAIKAFNETLRLNPRAVSAQLELSRLELAGGRVDTSCNSPNRPSRSRRETPTPGSRSFVASRRGVTSAEPRASCRL